MTGLDSHATQDGGEADSRVLWQDLDNTHINIKEEPIIEEVDDSVFRLATWQPESQEPVPRGVE